MSSQFILDLLLKQHYTIVKAVQVGNGKIEYIKAYNSNGRGVYIHMDLDGVVEISGNKKFIVKKIEPAASLIPSSHINSIDKISSASGMVYECQNQICAVMRKNDATIETPSYEVQIPLSNTVMNDGEILGYPLVLLSEILRDSEGALERAEEISDFIRSREVDRVEKEWNHLSESIQCLDDTAKRLCHDANKLLRKIESQETEILAHPTLPDDIKRCNIFVRGSLERKIFEMLKTEFCLYPQIRTVIQALRDTQHKIEELSRRLGGSDPCDAVLMSLPEDEDLLSFF